MNILITGASGFLGSALAQYWINKGADVHLLVRRDSTFSGPRSLVGPMRIHRIEDSNGLDAAVVAAQPDAVVHTACSYGRSGEGAWQLFDANVRLGTQLLQSLLDNSEKNISVLNCGTSLHADVSLYALSKSQFSAWGFRQAQLSESRLQFIDLPLQHMYGPGDDRSKFTSHVLHSCHENLKVLSLTAGEQKRDLIHIDDVVTAFDTVLRNRESLDIADTVAIGTGHATQLREFVQTAHRLTGSTTRLDFGAIPYRINEAMLCVADNQRLQTLGWKPIHGIVSGLTDTISKEFGK